MSKFTPGPWVITKDDEPGVLSIDAPDEVWYTLACAFLSGANEHDPAGNANARLIAAAPEMYELLLALSATDDIVSLHKEINDLLNKIDGESNE